MTETNLNGQTLDILKQNIENLKQLFPEVECEGKVDFDKLKQILGDYVEDSTERYNFSWNGKGRALRLAQSPSTGTLRPCKDESKNFDTTENLYIEGDNLEVLKLLQKSYHSKIKMIYIDPPYNTGKDFVYPDNYKDNMQNYLEITGQVDSDGKKIGTNSEASGRYHTDWLNMMYPRLRLARNLLKDDGVIFISIDDNEATNLKKLCDEVFGEDNFLGQITVVGNPRGRDYGGIAQMHDYILAYSKTSETEISLIQDKENQFKLFDSLGGFELRELRNRNIKFNKENRPNLYYPFYINTHEKDNDGLYTISLENHEGWFELFPLESQGINTVWRWGKPKSTENLNINIKAKAMQNGSYQIVEKYRESRVMARSVWWDKDTNTEKGTLLVKDLFDGKVFDYAKPLEMLMRMCEMGISENDLILDFFSGSATTAHAIMQLNAEDNGNRKFIMVQLPEPIEDKSNPYKNICEIGKERIRRAGEKIKTEIEQSNTQLKIGEDERQVPDIGFKVLKLDTSNIKKWQPDYDNLEQVLFDHIGNFVDGRTELDVVYEIMIKYGLSLTYPIEETDVNGKKVYIIALGMLVICLDDEITTDIAKYIIQYKNDNEIDEMRVVFKDNGFKDDSNKTNIKEILRQGEIKEFITI